MRKIFLTAVIASSALAAAAAPVELVTNGDFETGTFAGWTKSGNTGLSDVVSNTATSNQTFVWRSGATGSPAYISQALATTAGALYTLSFDVFNSATSNATFEADFNGSVVFSFSNEAHNWTHHVFANLLATGSSTELRFGARNDPSFTRLDNVSVVEVAPAVAPAAVPEPSSLALAAVGMGLLGCGRKRRAKAA